MFPSFATQTITRVRPHRVDDGHGNSIPDWTDPIFTVINGCSVQPGATDELLQSRDTTLIQWTVYAPAGVDVLSTDRIRLNGTDYEIDGEPARWASPTGAVSHTVLALKRWED